MHSEAPPSTSIVGDTATNRHTPRQAQEWTQTKTEEEEEKEKRESEARKRGKKGRNNIKTKAEQSAAHEIRT